MRKHETDMPHCWCNPKKTVMPNGIMHIIHNESIEGMIEQAQFRAKIMIPDNSAPIMTHDIEGDDCNGLSDCKIHPTT